MPKKDLSKLSVTERLRRNCKQRWRTFRHKALKWAVTYLAHPLMWLLMRSCRIEVKGTEHLHAAVEQGPCFLMLWHNRICFVPYPLWHHARDYLYTLVVSNSRDGELLTTLVKRYPQVRSLRVAHDSRHQALRNMVKRVKNGEILMITPDGPKGPRYNIKAGLAFSAKAAKANVVPMSWSASTFWQTNSWDKMIIPKPFSKVFIEFGQPIRHEELETVDEGTEVLQERLRALTKETCSQLTADSSAWPE